MSRTTLDVLLFAGAADAVGADRVSVEVELPIDVSSLARAIAEAHPQLSRIIPASRLAVDQRFVPTDHIIVAPPRELALIPPVSGG